jgi:murein DD-endopeptidase MepM/ murein hydrolase activator NlpD
MTKAAATTKSGWRHDVSTFFAGAGCGFLAGALLVFGLLWHFDVLGATSSRDPSIPRERDQGGMAVLEPAGIVVTPAADTPRSADASPRSLIGPEPSNTDDLKQRDLLIPVEGVQPDQLTRQFSEPRGVSRAHEALDILAPRNTPVRAVEDGTIARLFLSKAGGNTVYQFDPTATFCYYYAHLERYADGLREGAPVHKGQVLGFVGTSGNAPKQTPHLHFAIFRLTEAKRWWEGTAIDPYDVLR